MDALPTSPLGQRLLTLFPYRWNWIESLNDSNSSPPKWTTITKHPVKARSLWAKYLDAARLVGVRFGSSTEYFMLDVDSESAYLGQIPRILEALETIGICRTLVIRSSWSGGVHIYAPLPRKFPTFSVAVAVAAALDAQGLSVQAGQLEVFPNEKTYARNWLGEFSQYNAHRLPLQPASGSHMLNCDLQPLPRGDELSIFLAAWDNAMAQQDEELLSEAIAIGRSNRRRRRRSVGPVAEWKADLELVIGEGWTGHGQTNDLLKQIGCYGRVFLGLAGAELAEYIQRTAEAAPGYTRFCRHQHEIWRRCCMWGRAVEGYYWPLGSEPLRQRPSLASICEERANDARERIAAAKEQLGAFEGTIKAMARELARLAKTSLKTLYKYPDLWHPCPPPPPEPPSRPVTDHTAGVPGPLGSILQQVRESLESADLAWVTRLGGENEMWGAEKPPEKNLNSGKGRGSREGEGEHPGENHD